MKKSLTNFFGTLGYIACVAQWLWALTLYSNVLLPFLHSVTPAPKSTPVIIHHAASATNMVSMVALFVIGSIITIGIIALCIWLIIKTPSTITKTASKVVHETAETIAPIVLHVQHKKDTVINHKKTTSTIRLVVKLLFIIIPFVAAILSQLTSKPLFNGTVIVCSGLVFAGISLLFFGIQHLLQIALKTDKKTDTL